VGIGDIGLRDHFPPGQGCYRERAAYLLDVDHLCGLPCTGLVHIEHPCLNYRQRLGHGHSHQCGVRAFPKLGSLQRFVRSEDSFENFGRGFFRSFPLSPIPPSLPLPSHRLAFYTHSVYEVQKIALLDLRILNCDRNSANILVHRKNPDTDPDEDRAVNGSGHGYGMSPLPGNLDTDPFSDYSHSLPRHSGEDFVLVPIDHGYCLPPRLQVFQWDWCWFGYDQIKAPLHPRLRKYLEGLDIEKHIRELERELGHLPGDCIFLVRVMHTLLLEAVRAGLSLWDVANLVAREVDDEPSKVEQLVAQAEEIALQRLETYMGAGGGVGVDRTYVSAGMNAPDQSSHPLRLPPYRPPSTSTSCAGDGSDEEITTPRPVQQLPFRTRRRSSVLGKRDGDRGNGSGLAEGDRGRAGSDESTQSTDSQESPSSLKEGVTTSEDGAASGESSSVSNHTSRVPCPTTATPFPAEYSGRWDLAGQPLRSISSIQPVQKSENPSTMWDLRGDGMRRLGGGDGTAVVLGQYRGERVKVTESTKVTVPVVVGGRDMSDAYKRVASSPYIAWDESHGNGLISRVVEVEEEYERALLSGGSGVEQEKRNGDNPVRGPVVERQEVQENTQGYDNAGRPGLPSTLIPERDPTFPLSLFTDFVPLPIQQRSPASHGTIDTITASGKESSSSGSGSPWHSVSIPAAPALARVTSFAGLSSKPLFDVNRADRQLSILKREKRRRLEYVPEFQRLKLEYATSAVLGLVGRVVKAKRPSGRTG